MYSKKDVDALKKEWKTNPRWKGIQLYIGEMNSMFRTTVMLPSNLKNRAKRFAVKKGISVGELIRESLEEKLQQNKTSSTKSDPFFDDVNFFSGDVPTDLSANHEEYN